MAITAVYPAKICVGSLYASTANEIDVGTDIEMLDGTTFGTVPYRQYVAGLVTISFTVNGFQDFSTLQPDSSAERTRGLAGTIAPLSCAPLGATDGNMALLTAGVVESTARLKGPIGQIQVMEIMTQPRGIPLVEGVVSDAGTVDRTASYNGANSQLGAVASTQEVYANIHVVDTTGSGGTPTITPRIESDTVGFGSPTTIVTGTAMSPTVGTGSSQTISANGPFTDDYYRVSCTISGVTPHLKIFAVVGVSKLTT